MPTRDVDGGLPVHAPRSVEVRAGLRIRGSREGCSAAPTYPLSWIDRSHDDGLTIRTCDQELEVVDSTAKLVLELRADRRQVQEPDEGALSRNRVGDDDHLMACVWVQGRSDHDWCRS